MYNTNIKAEVINNVIFQMSQYVDRTTLDILQKILEEQNRGADIGIIQEIMGHASPEVTARYYAESTPETLRSVRIRTSA